MTQGATVKILVGGYAGDRATIRDVEKTLDGRTILTLTTESSVVLWYYRPDQVEAVPAPQHIAAVSPVFALQGLSS